MEKQLLINIDEQVIDDKKIYVVNLSGKVDAATVDEFQEQVALLLKDADLINMIIDMTNLHYINSKFVGYIINWHMKATEKDGKIILVGAQEYILDVLNVQGVLQIIPHCLTREEAHLLF